MAGLPALRGALFALVAALLFGASTPLVQRAGTSVGGWMTAALLYAGAAAAGFLLRSRSSHEAAVERRHWPRLLLMAGSGAVVGPAALAWGLQHTSGTSASLMLTLEAVFTAVLAHLLYGEQIDRRVGLAMALLTLGGALLVFDRAETGSTQVVGLVAVVGATVAWGVDNALSRGLADLDPGRVVLGKAFVGAACSLVLAAAAGQMPVPWTAALSLFLIGAIGYGLSLRFYLLAQRAFGVARTGSVFAAAPFVGAALAFGLGERGFSLWLVGGAALMLAGVILHLSEQHEHAHQHELHAHEHAHTHDDGHHDHTHETPAFGAHSHPHVHEPTRHSHPHTPDLHHTHIH
jgi:drug/metabolite transporter (DMT)-like permease